MRRFRRRDMSLLHAPLAPKRSAPRFASVLLGRGDSFCFEILLEALQAVLPPDPRLFIAAEGTVGAVRHCAIDHE